MEEPGRQYNYSYPYSFNGKRDDKDANYGWQDYGYREYDKRLVRFTSVDPLTKKYPMLSTYQYASNRPIDGMDLDGLEYLPYLKSMYQLQYSINSTTYTLGSGKQQTVTTDQTVVRTVYENIPASLQDAKTNSFKYVTGGPVTASGRDWDVKQDGPTIYEPGRYYNNGPEFYGLAGATSTNGITSLKGNVTPGTLSTANGLGASVGLLGKNGAGVIANQFNKSTWDALGEEQQSRNGFYNATNTVDFYFKNNAIGDKSLLSTSGRAGLINFLTDGSLNSKSSNVNNLKVAFTGLQIMQRENIEIRAETLSGIQGLLKKYKANGGGTEYDALNKF